MADNLQKLRPDRDLQCYFLRPSAIAALSGTSPNGFTVSGCWRQQFDWAVVEWNRDNVYEHPMFRNLPDGDLSGITLTYEETRTNCIPIDSTIYPTVDWPSLRIWADDGTGEKIYKVALLSYASPIQGSYTPATAQIQLQGTVQTGDNAGFAFLDEHYPYFYSVTDMVNQVNGNSQTMVAALDGTKIQLTYVGTAADGSRNSVAGSTTGFNGNRIGLYTYSQSSTASWNVGWQQFSGGTSPTTWEITLPFASLSGVVVDPITGITGTQLVPIPAKSIRRIRWTYAADLQPGAFQRSEFQVAVSNWAVTGIGINYSVAGPGSRRIDDTSSQVTYAGNWTSSTGNFFGGTINFTSTAGDSISCRYNASSEHSLYLGTRMAASCPTIQISLDGQILPNLSLYEPIADILIRHPLGSVQAGTHTVSVKHAGSTGQFFYFDFLELAIPTTTLPVNPVEPSLTLATDWDTDQSIALAPERTAWMVDSLGFKGRINHYAGALWFYELARPGQQYASGTISFDGAPPGSAVTTLLIGQTGSTPVAITHLNVVGESAQTLAKAFELLINSGYTAVWANASGSVLTIYSRSMGQDGNDITIGVQGSTTTTISGPTLTGGADGAPDPTGPGQDGSPMTVQLDGWRTDLTAMPRINRAARDWTASFCAAMKNYGHTKVTASFSTELQHGDFSPAAGIAQRYPSGLEVMVSTPALQTNFSPTSLAFWQQVYADMAKIQNDAGLQPYLQFGELQWWYFTDGDHSGMPFYDEYTTSTFKAQYGRDMAIITSNETDPATLQQEASFLPSLIGQHTRAIMAYVRNLYPNCMFEALYPTDVNSSALNKVVNYPSSDWTSSTLDCLKTESFSYTFGRNLDLAVSTIKIGEALGFPPSKRSHLVGLESSTTAWLKEARKAESYRFDSVVLFALDQFCLIGYPLPLSRGMRRSVLLG